MNKCVLCQTGLHTHALLTPTTNNSSIITNPSHPIPMLDSLPPLHSLSDISSTFQSGQTQRKATAGSACHVKRSEADMQIANNTWWRFWLLLQQLPREENRWSIFSECVCDGVIPIGDLHPASDWEADLSCLARGKAGVCEEMPFNSNIQITN